MRATDVIDNICIKYSVSKREISDRIKIGPQNFNQKVARGTLRIDEFMAVLDCVNLKIAYRSTKNGKKVECKNSIIATSEVLADGLFDVLYAFGIEAVFVDKKTGEIIEWVKAGEEKARELEKHYVNFRAMYQGVFYDTERSKIITNNFGEEDIFNDNEIARELYIDKNGEYFFAEYRRDPDAKNKVRAISKEEAEAFINENGRKF